MKTQIKDILSTDYLCRSGMLCDDNVLQLLVKGLLDQDLDTLYVPEFNICIHYDGFYSVDISTDRYVRMKMYIICEDSDGQMYELTTHIVGEVHYSLDTWTKVESLLDLIE